jgi:hypothetical protein
MNDYDWMVAETEEQAKSVYEKSTDFDRTEIDADFQGEVGLSNTTLVSIDDLSEEEKKVTQLNMRNIGGELLVYMPFSWVIEHDKITKPCVIATTER